MPTAKNLRWAILRRHVDNSQNRLLMTWQMKKIICKMCLLTNMYDKLVRINSDWPSLRG